MFAAGLVKYGVAHYDAPVPRKDWRKEDLDARAPNGHFREFGPGAGRPGRRPPFTIDGHGE